MSYLCSHLHRWVTWSKFLGQGWENICPSETLGWKVCRSVRRQCCTLVSQNHHELSNSAIPEQGSDANSCSGEAGEKECRVWPSWKAQKCRVTQVLPSSVFPCEPPGTHWPPLSRCCCRLGLGNLQMSTPVSAIWWHQDWGISQMLLVHSNNGAARRFIISF